MSRKNRIIRLSLLAIILQAISPVVLQAERISKCGNLYTTQSCSASKHLTHRVNKYTHPEYSQSTNSFSSESSAESSSSEVTRDTAESQVPESRAQLQLSPFSSKKNVKLRGQGTKIPLPPEEKEIPRIIVRGGSLTNEQIKQMVGISVPVNR